MPLCVVDYVRMAFVNRVNSVNLSTNLKNPAANTNARVSDPVLTENVQGPFGFGGYVLFIDYVIRAAHLAVLNISVSFIDV